MELNSYRSPCHRFLPCCTAAGTVIRIRDCPVKKLTGAHLCSSVMRLISR